MKKKMRRWVLITGATSGIGKATAKLFGRKGFDLILTGRRIERLNELSAKMTSKYGVKVKIRSFDVRDQQACAKAVKSLESIMPDLKVLINNAGLASGLDPIQTGSLDDWEKMLDTNVKGLLYMTRLIAPFMIKNKKGHIINTSSTAGHEVYPMGNVYCASKHAVTALTKAMRMDLYKDNIRVSQVSPGHVEETEFAKVRFHGDEKKAKIYEDFNPLKSKDVAKVIYFIASQPKHVNIHDVILTGTQQASGMVMDRSGRIYDKT